MSNFFRHLLLRSISPTAATVQPRLASRFEAGPASARLIEGHGEPSPTPPQASQPTTGAAPYFPPPRAERLVSLPQTPAPGVPAATSSSSTLPPPVAALAIPTIAPLPLPSSPTPPVPAAHIAPPPLAPRETFVLYPSPTNSRLVEHVTERIREITPPIAAGVSASVAPATARNPAPTLTPHPTPNFPAPPQTSLVPAAHLAAAPAPAPTIQVTIGRVDIRAIHAPPAPAARAPVPARRPLVSLEHYLNQRDPK